MFESFLKLVKFRALQKKIYALQKKKLVKFQPLKNVQNFDKPSNNVQID